MLEICYWKLSWDVSIFVSDAAQMLPFPSHQDFLNYSLKYGFLLNESTKQKTVML